MDDRKKEFLTDLVSLMERYGAEFEVQEECRGYGGYNGFQVTGVDINFSQQPLA